MEHVTTCLSAKLFSGRLQEIEERPATYFFFFVNGLELLHRAGYFFFENRPPLCIDGKQLLYIGSARNVRRRLLAHLRGDSRQSSLRCTLGALLREELKLSPILIGDPPRCHFGQGEERLTKWIAEYAHVGFEVSPHAARLERQAIQSLCPPLNITHLPRSGFAQHLRTIRRALGPGFGHPWLPAGPVRRAMLEEARRLNSKSISQSDHNG